MYNDSVGNAIIPIVGTVGVLMAQASTTFIESATPLGIVALCVYYFLAKFDKKMDALMERTKSIESVIIELSEDKKEDE